MDNNTMPTPPPAPPPGAPAQAAAPASAPVNNPITPTVTEVKKGGKMKWVLIGVSILLAIGAGVYYFMNHYNKPAVSESAPVSQTTPKTDTVASMQKDLGAIDVPPSVESDFTQIDKDLSSL